MPQISSSPKRTKGLPAGASLLFLIGMSITPHAMAQDGASVSIELMVGNLWVLMAAALVFIMHLGFATLEAGLTQAKNTVNILFKNVCVIAIGILMYALIGFNLMYPGEDYAGGFFGFSGFWLDSRSDITLGYNENYTYWTDFIFQAVFAATAVTIVSGAVAERIRVEVFIAFAFLYVTFCYPVVGMWKWGGGFLDAMETPFYDFAGSTLVHSVGGWAALVGSMMLGPRIGKYVGSEVNVIRPSNMALATIGVFLLWFGWYGFNGGSVLSADPLGISYVFVTTSIAGASGILGAMLASLVLIKHLDLAMLLNGALGGLVGITAGADQLGTFEAAVTGVLAGMLVVASVLFIDRKLKIDDPVGAISVHLVCGIWGTIAVGIFGDLASPAQFISQLIGVVSIGAYCVVFAFIAFTVINSLMGLRVSEDVEVAGLDRHEHGIAGYRGYRVVDTAAVFTEVDVKALVSKAISYVKDHGAEAAFAQFNRPDGGFIRGDLYIFVVDLEGRYMAGGPFTEKVGNEMIAADGKAIGQEIAEKSSGEGVWITYQWRQPTVGKVKRKRSWMVRHNDYIFGAGIYED